MQSSARLLVTLACIVASGAIPLNLVMEDGSALSGDLKDPLTDAMHDVNNQVPKMQKTLDDAEKGDEAAVKRVQLAFGPKGVEHIPTIRNNINTIAGGTVHISGKSQAEVDKDWSPNPKRPNPQIAITPFDYRTSASDNLKTYPVEFGSGFNVGADKRKMNAATVLHESAHALFHASDDHYKDGTKDIVPMGIEHTDEQLKNIKEQGGYASKSPVVATEGNPITDKRLSKNFKDVRDSSTNMHMNADSYALFGAVCDAEVARLRKRALMEGDVAAYHLAKRAGASCKLPPDYFAKKAAAAKAAKEKAAGVTPASQKMTKGEKTPAATGKGAPKVLGKTTKSAFTKSSKSGIGKGSKSKLSPAKTSKTSARGKPSKATSSKLSKSSRTKAPKGQASKALSKSTRTKSASGKASKARTSAGRSSSTKKGAGGVRKKSGASGGKSRVATGKASKAASSKATSAARKAAGALTKGSTSKKVAKVLKNPVVTQVTSAALSKKKGGKL